MSDEEVKALEKVLEIVQGLARITLELVQVKKKVEEDIAREAVSAIKEFRARVLIELARVEARRRKSGSGK